MFFSMGYFSSSSIKNLSFFCWVNILLYFIGFGGVLNNKKTIKFN